MNLRTLTYPAAALPCAGVREPAHPALPCLVWVCAPCPALPCVGLRTLPCVEVHKGRQWSRWLAGVGVVGLRTLPYRTLACAGGR